MTDVVRPVIVVRPYDESDAPWVFSSLVDAIAVTKGGQYSRRDLIRKLLGELADRSDIDIATSEAIPGVALGVAFWGEGRVLEMLYLRLSLSETFPGDRERKPLQIGKEVTRALLGVGPLVRLRRLPPQSWAWRTIHAEGYVPTVMPEAL